MEQLLLDATLGMLSQESVDEAIDAAGRASDDPAERVAAMVDALAAMSADTLSIGRTLIRLTVDSTSDDDESPRRGYRRIAWIERAIEPLRDQLDPASFERLVSALAMVVGWEAMIVLHDLRGLSPEDQAATSVWAARALIRASLEEAAAPGPSGGVRRVGGSSPSGG
jgi:hypothetical protein